MDCVPPPGPTDGQIREVLEVAEKAARAVGARDDVLDDVKQITADKLAARWHEPNVIAARTIGGRKWRGYVGIAARHTYFDVLRSEKRRRKRQRLALDAPEPRTQRPGTHRYEETTPSEIDLFLGQETVKDLLDRHLTGNEHAVAWGLYVDGKSIDDLAVDLDRAARTIRDYRQGAIKKLRAALRPPRPAPRPVDGVEGEDDGRDHADDGEQTAS